MKKRNPEKMQAKKQFLSKLMKDAASFRNEGLSRSFAIRKAWLLRLKAGIDYKLRCDMFNKNTVNVMLGGKQVGSVTMMSDGYFSATNCVAGTHFGKSKIVAFEFSISNIKKKEGFQFSLL